MIPICIGEGRVKAALIQVFKEKQLEEEKLLRAHLDGQRQAWPVRQAALTRFTNASVTYL